LDVLQTAIKDITTNSFYTFFFSFIWIRNAREDTVIWWKLTVQQKIVGSDSNSWLQVNV